MLSHGRGLHGLMSEPFAPDYDKGSPQLRLPDELRAPMRAHFEQLRKWYEGVGWGARTGFGKRPAIVVIDLAIGWTQDDGMMGSNIESVVESTVRLLAAGREVGLPIFFTTSPNDPADPPRPRKAKGWFEYDPGRDKLMELDPRLERRITEKIIYKPYASVFNGTNFQNMLTRLGVDTLIVTGVSTSHCVYATCRDGCSAFRVIVPREAVGERCELMHEVNLLDIDIDCGDVMSMDEVISAVEVGSR